MAPTIPPHWTVVFTPAVDSSPHPSQPGAYEPALSPGACMLGHRICGRRSWRLCTCNRRKEIDDKNPPRTIALTAAPLQNGFNWIALSAQGVACGAKRELERLPRNAFDKWSDYPAKAWGDRACE
jgi:hypothetical protein